MHAARQAQMKEVCPTTRGYLTNLFDVADPDFELPRCSDPFDGETLLPPPPPFVRRDSVSGNAGMW